MSSAPTWDLSFLFASTEDPKIEQVWTDVADRADRFQEKYKGNLAGLTPAELRDAIQQVEEIYSMASKPSTFAGLLFSAHASDPKVGAFYQQQAEQEPAIQVKTLFFSLELQAMGSEKLLELANDPELRQYQHFLRELGLSAKHRLSEPEEALLAEFSPTTDGAWVRYFTQLTSSTECDYTDPKTGEATQIPFFKALDKLYSPERAVRVAGGAAVSSGCERLLPHVSYLYNNLVQHKRTEDRLRKFDSPEAARHLSNELTNEVVETVVGLCEVNFPMVDRYYSVKREILGLESLDHVDRYAPLFPAEQTMEFEEARKLILQSFGEFDPRMEEAASEFFTDGWIEAEAREGKRGGAFCAYITPDTHPVVFMTYMGKLKDVQTLAHELGHGVHAYFSRKQSMLNFSGTLPLAELASTFGEMLVFESQLQSASLKDRVALLADKIEGSFATIFRQAAMYRFEQAVHHHRATEGELSAEQLGELWQENLQRMFGASVKLGDEHKNWWSYVPHFIGSPFYVYAYSFGELLALSLFSKAKSEGKPFVEKYFEVLELGGSKTPDELMSIVGVDLADENFWREGFSVLENLLSEFETLWQEYRAQNSNG
ncbi:MAG: M3 family oligoendopeptidase [Fimbriimonadaceae bacterium]